MNVVLVVVLHMDFETYYCASCGGWYPIGHFCE